MFIIVPIIRDLDDGPLVGGRGPAEVLINLDNETIISASKYTSVSILLLLLSLLV